LPLLGFKDVVIYAHPLTDKLAELFRPEKSPYVVVREENGDFSLKHPQEAWKDRGVFAIHWIYEYSPCRIKLNDITIESTTNNRFMPTYNPINNRLRISDDFKEWLLKLAKESLKKGEKMRMLISGMQLLSEKYPPDGTYPEGATGMDYLLPIADFLRQVKAENDEIEMHFEMTSIASPVMRNAVIDVILPIVDSFGLSEENEYDILVCQQLPEMAEQIRSNSVGAMLKGAKFLMEKALLKRIHLHTRDFNMVIIQKGCSNPEEERMGLVLGAAFTAQRAAEGELEEQADMNRVLDIPVYAKSIEQMKLVGEHIGCGADFLRTGICSWGKKYSVIFVPNRVVLKPVLTVGMGDRMATVAFLTRGGNRNNCSIGRMEGWKE